MRNRLGLGSKYESDHLVRISGSGVCMRGMARHRRLHDLVAAVVLVGGLLGGAAVYAERPAAPYLLPDQTLALLRIADTRDFLRRMNEASIGRMLKDEQVKPLADRLYGSVAQAFSQVQDRVGLPLDQLLSIPQGEVFLAVVPREGAFPQPVFMMDVGESLTQMRTLMQRADEELSQRGVAKSTESDGDATLNIYTPPGGTPEAIVLFQKETTIGVTTSVQVARNVLAAWRGDKMIEGKEFVSLAQNRKFTAIMSRCSNGADDRPPLSFYVDPIDLVRAVASTNPAARTGLALLPVIGVDSLEAIGGSVYLISGDFENITHLHLLLSSPRTGVVKALALSAGDITPEPFVPSDAVNYATIHWDFDASYREVSKLINSFQGEGAVSNAMRNRFSEPLGVDFEKEFLPQLTGRITYVSGIEKPVRINSQTQMIALQVKDGKQATAKLDAVMSKFADNFTKKPYGGIHYYQSSAITPGPRVDVESQDRRVQMSVRAPQPTFAVLADYLVFADSSKMIEQAVITMADTSGGLANELDFKLIASRIRSQLGGIEPGAITFNRPEEGMRFLYDLATGDEARGALSSRAGDNNFLQSVDSALKENPLPPFAVLSKYLAPGGGLVTNDETGFHYLGFTLKRK